MVEDQTEHRRMIIEGRPTIVVERTPPIAPTLELMLNGGRGPDGRYWSPLRVTTRNVLRVGGATSACMREDHRLVDWLRGFYTGSDRVARSLLLRACADCGAICVRDVSVDVLPGLSTGSQAPRRRDHIIGWYTGARPRQRVYT